MRYTDCRDCGKQLISTNRSGWCYVCGRRHRCKVCGEFFFYEFAGGICLGCAELCSDLAEIPKDKVRPPDLARRLALYERRGKKGTPIFRGVKRVG